jgi:hypothetical protein
VTITHDGFLKKSMRFDASLPGELTVVLGCLEYILRKTMDMIPTSTPEEIQARVPYKEEPADADDPIRLDDNEFLHQPTGEDEGDEDDDGGPSGYKWR